MITFSRNIFPTGMKLVRNHAGIGTSRKHKQLQREGIQIARQKLNAQPLPLDQTHQFNLKKWSSHSYLENKLWGPVRSLFDRSPPKGISLVERIPEVGETIHVGNQKKIVIGYNGGTTPHDPLDDRDPEINGDLFYGNQYVAEKYAGMKLQHVAKTYFRIVVGNELPKKEHHGEAWFPGNWEPLTGEAVKTLGIEVYPVKMYLGLKIK